MKRIRSLGTILYLIVLLFISSNINAIPAYPYPIEFRQPDGSNVTIIIKGDEKVHWRETLDGYTLMFDDKGFLTYGIIDNQGFLAPSNIIATDITERSVKENSFLTGINKNLFYNPEQISMMTQVWDINKKSMERGFDNGVIGNFKTICVLVDFPSKKMVKTKDDFNLLMNQEGYGLEGAKGSVKDYFRATSYNKLNFDVTVVGPFTAPEEESFYAGYSGTDQGNVLASWAIQEAAKVIDCSQFDNDNDGWLDGFHFIFAGAGQETGAGSSTIWSHKWNFDEVSVSGKKIDTYSCSPEFRRPYSESISSIGVICHEMAHAFGSPDYYDTDYSNGTLQYSGTGSWDLMANGSYNGSGHSPANINMYQKIRYKWVEPIELTSPKSIFNMLNSNDFPIAYIINTETLNEYFILENRQKVGFDSYLNGHGLIIYRVHKDMFLKYNVNNTHPQKLYPVCAGSNVDIPNRNPSSYGNINSEACPFPGSSKKSSFTDTSVPSAKSWAAENTNKPLTNIVEDVAGKTISFDFMGGIESNCGPKPIDFIGNIPEDSSNPSFTWSNEENSNPSGYYIYRNGIKISDKLNSTSYTDLTNLTYSSYSYCVTAIYNDCESYPSANFVIEIPKTIYNVVVEPNIAEAGKIKGTGQYKQESIVSLSATANEGYSFVNYTENGVEVSKFQRYKFKILSDVNLIANFEKVNSVEIENNISSDDIFAFDNTIVISVNNISSKNILNAEIYDINGKIIGKHKCYEGENRFKIDKSGIYIVKLKSNGFIVSKKVIIR